MALTRIDLSERVPMHRIVAAVGIFALSLAPAFADGAKEAPPKPAAGDAPRPPVVRGAMPDPEPIAKLIEKLGVRDYKTREAAGKVLETRGVEALPELRKALGAVTDAEVRRRLQGMVDKLERIQVLSPKRVTIKAKDRPVREIIADIARQTGYPMQYQGGNQTVTVEKENVSFWEMMDYLANTAGLTMWHNEGQGMMFYNNESQFWPFVAYEGPFKIAANNFSYNKTVNLGPMQRNPAQNQFRTESLTFQFTIHAEPKLPLMGMGQAKVIEAIDDLGNSMRPGDHGVHESSYPPNYNGYRSYQYGTSVNLNWPNKESRVVKRLRVAVPVMVLSEQKPEVVIDDILKVKKQKFTGGTVEVTIEEVKEQNNKTQYHVKMSVRNTASNAAQDYSWTNSVHQRIELRDAKGNRWHSQGYNWENSSPGHVTATFMFGNNGGAVVPGPPARLIYNHWNLMPHTIEFEFKDLQLP
jgi:hypothetical protein